MVSAAAAIPQPMTSLSLPQQHATNDNHHHHYLRRHDTTSDHQSNNNHKIKYYFYDPQDLPHGPNRNNNKLHLPQFVYDSLGRLIPLTSLASHHLTTMIHPNATVLNATVYNYTHTHPPVVETRRNRRMPWNNNGSTWSTAKALRPTTTTTTISLDPSLMIGTVGVMALLVGALSARRMRRSSDGGCCGLLLDHDALLLENDDDDEHATTYHNNNNSSNHQYHTFAPGWKGDLEKFDV